MAVLGLGLGCTMQNLVLSVQNNVAQSDLGAASSRRGVLPLRWVARSASPCSARCSATRSPTSVADGLARLGIQVDAHEQGSIPDLATLPAPVRAVFEHAFGEATGHLFLVAVPFAVMALLCVSCSSRRCRCAPPSS